VEEELDISLVICTRNRAGQLGSCLEKVADLTFDGDWEFIVVDNGSSDATATVIAEFAARAPMTVKYVHQPLKGLSNARNAGIAQAKGAIIAFTDDDCYVAPDFLTTTVAAFREAEIGFVSGRILLHDPTDYPATISLSTEPRDLPRGSYVVPGVLKGANMAFRREVLAAISGFDPLFGSGAAFPAEDCDAAARASLAGWNGRYVPSIVVAHHHGRKADSIPALHRDYDIGRGAYHAKLLLSCGAPLHALRGLSGLPRRVRWRPSCGYWETYGAVHYTWTWLKRSVVRSDRAQIIHSKGDV
jgi:glycosyltransferase involved in cell wall biosynthesis